jgi:nitroreductase/NAD-dependent dihydropyrimidine dehydrogenase PreA subunit
VYIPTSNPRGYLNEFTYTTYLGTIYGICPLAHFRGIKELDKAHGEDEMIEIDSTKCNKCGFCFEVCPNYVLALGKGREIQLRYPEQCCVCGHCVAICPQNALVHKELPIEKFENLPITMIPPENMRNLLLSRRSIRVFQEKPVPKELIEQLIEVGIYGGTSSNGQSEKFVVIQDRKLLSQLEEMVIDVLWNSGMKYLGSRRGQILAKTKLGGEMLTQAIPYHHVIKNRRKNNELGGMIFRNAPVVMVIHGLRTNFMAHANCSIAARNMEIMAKTIGLGTCWVGYLPLAAHLAKKKIERYLEIPDSHSIYGAVMVGYPKFEYRKIIPRKEREIRWI